jgi:flagellar export protein FliJ
MAFRFPLQAVLHLRESIEHQHELRLSAANQQVARVKRLIEQVDRCILESQQQSSRELESGTSAAEIRFTLEMESHLRARRRDLELELTRLTRFRDQQQQLFHQARRERETFSILREHQLREYQRNQSRREQRLLDELFLSRQSFRKRG